MGEIEEGGREMEKNCIFFKGTKTLKSLQFMVLTGFSPPETLHVASPGVANALAEGVSQVLWVCRESPAALRSAQVESCSLQS